MPTIWMFGAGDAGFDEPRERMVPAVNRGRKRGITKSSKPRRKR